MAFVSNIATQTFSGKNGHNNSPWNDSSLLLVPDCAPPSPLKVTNLDVSRHRAWLNKYVHCKLAAGSSLPVFVTMPNIQRLIDDLNRPSHGSSVYCHLEAFYP